MRLYGLLGLLLVLSACAPSSSSTPNVSGSWQDNAAAVTACGETYSVATALDLTQTGTELKGTFTIQGNANPFTGEVAVNQITGDVRGDDGSGLTAALALQQNRLVGTFTAIEEISCTDGGTSVTVYKASLAR